MSRSAGASVQPVTEMETLVGDVVIRELWGPGDPEQLFAEERLLIADAVESRVMQFAAGRQCARAAMAELDVAPTVLGRGPGRSVIWPSSVWGAITHTDGYAAAVVGLRDRRPGPVGIDAEQVGRVEDQLHPRLFLPEEQAWLDGLEQSHRAAAATELFGLKECLYKAQFPLTGAWVGFHDVRVDGPSSGSFTDPHRHWSLHAATGLPVLTAVRWPCRGWSMARGPDAAIALTVVAAVVADGVSPPS